MIAAPGAYNTPTYLPAYLPPFVYDFYSIHSCVSFSVRLGCLHV